MERDPIYIVKADGSRELFDISKLEHSLKRAGADSKVTEGIVNELSDTLIDGSTTYDIYHQAFELLHSKDRPVALKYSLKRAIMEFGPSGFPFEKYVAEIFKYRGFETLTGQMVKGFCVEHEIDMIAWNDEKLIMAEAKFHNQLGIKSDLKVALYVKARFEDLSKVEFEFYGKKRKLDEGWLITNTKFSKTAIEYGQCQGLKMVGWNYPSDGSLHDMIIEEKLHPLTCLTTLSGQAKKELLDRGVVLCKTILQNPVLLEEAKLLEEEKLAVENEIKGL